MDEVRTQFRELYENDVLEGRLRARSAYQRLFPGFEDVVAEEHARLEGARDRYSDSRLIAEGGMGRVVPRARPTAPSSARLEASSRCAGSHG